MANRSVLSTQPCCKPHNLITLPANISHPQSTIFHSKSFSVYSFSPVQKISTLFCHGYADTGRISANKLSALTPRSPFLRTFYQLAPFLLVRRGPGLPLH